jgi:DNA polymerase (family 10)
MPVHNADIAAIFDEIADLLEIEGDNPFRIRAYRNAARTLRDLGREASSMIEHGEDLTDLPGIGDDLAAKIRDIIATGATPLLSKLRKRVPPALTELLHIPGLGPKRVKTLYHELDIHTLEQLQRAALDGRIHSLPGFGVKTEQHILQALKAQTGVAKRFPLALAAQYAESLVSYLQQVPGVKQVVIAGSYRRAKETVGDIDILVTARPTSPVIDRFVAYSEVAEITARGKTRAAVRLASKLQVDVRVVPDESYGAALHYFTGSKAHNIAIRELGQQRGLKINEYGVFKNSHRIAGETEESVFQSVGLPFIPPELRENYGEIAAAQAGKLPQLVELRDLKGDLHAHTTATDGRNSLEAMAQAAREHGLEYLAITEHSKRVTVAHGLDARRLLAEIEEIDRLNATLTGITLLKGIEVDILEDGKLDLPDDILARLDLVIGAVHSRMHLSREQQTTRILRAMERPYFTILAHPTGRLIQEREPYDVDMPRIIRQARERGCFLELNAHPERLDLLDTYCRLAKEEGVLVSINSDAHSVMDFNNLRFGVGQARRGWLEKADVLNTRPLHALRPLLRRAR